MTRLLKMIESKKLRHLQINDYRQSNPVHWEKCLSLVASRFHSSLRGIEFKASPPTSSRLQGKTPMHFVQPLLRLRELKHVSLDFPASMQWTKRDHRMMAAAWPQIEILSLRGRDKEHYITEPVAHPHVFVNYLRRCPALEQLILPKVDLRPEVLADIQPVSSSSVRVIDLGYRWYSPVPDPALVVQFLRSSCPRLSLSDSFFDLMEHDSAVSDKGGSDEASNDIVPKPEWGSVFILLCESGDWDHETASESSTSE